MKKLRINRLSILLLLCVVLSSVKADDCTYLSDDTTCPTDSECENYVVNQNETACVNCYARASGVCGSSVDAVCATFKANPSDLAGCIIDCSIKVGNGCNSDSSCSKYVFDQPTDKCVDCTIPTALTQSCGMPDVCKNGSTVLCSSNICQGYVINNSHDTCVNCSVLVDSECNSDILCQNYKKDGNKCTDCSPLTSNGSECIDCKAVQNGKCQFASEEGCTNYRTDQSPNPTTCIDCSKADTTTQTCVNALVSGCNSFKYDSTQQICIDCSLASNVDCINSSRTACDSFRFTGQGSCIDCSTLASNGTSCKNGLQSACLSFKYNSGSCQDCSVSIAGECTNKSAICSTFVYSELYQECVNCAQVSNNQCINASVPLCYHYKLQSPSNTDCVDCNSSTGSACTYDTSSTCKGYEFSTSTSKCVNCSQVQYGQCLNKSDPLCANYKFNGKNTCLDCQVASGGICANQAQSGCSEYKYDTSSSLCYDCSLPNSDKTCLNKDRTGCATYGYGGTGKCYDCSIVDNSSCLNQSIAGCLNYRYNEDSSPEVCVDCTVPNGESCENKDVPGCLAFKYNSDTNECFDCYSPGQVWTDTMCYACFVSANIITANSDATGCKSPYEDDATTTTTTESNSSTILGGTISLLVYVYILIQ